MILPLVCYKAGPNTKSAQAISRGGETLERWLTSGLYHGHEDLGRQVCSGWAYADLQGEFAHAYLMAQGLDTADLDAELDAAGRIPDSVELDILTAWERSGR